MLSQSLSAQHPQILIVLYILQYSCVQACNYMIDRAAGEASRRQTPYPRTYRFAPAREAGKFQGVGVGPNPVC